ncbi:hypothetical protein HYR54_13425 [Candidatus Acetothermia bacterium]|nr:hypothetical protein [Candidatus Acetothermia bacterium]
MESSNENRSFAQIVWKGRWLLVVIVIASVIGTGIYAYRLPPEFATEAVFHLRPLTEVEAAVKPYLPSAPTLLRLLQSQEVLLQTIEDARLQEQPAFTDWTKPRLADWLRGHLQVTQPDKTDLLVVELNGPFKGGKEIKEFTDRYVAVFQKKIQTQLRQSLETEQGRLDRLQQGLSQAQQNIIQEATQRATAKRPKLQAQEKEIKDAMTALKSKERNLRMPAGEQNASFEGVTLREDYLALVSQLKEVQKELAQLDDNGGVSTFDDLYGTFKEIGQESVQISLLSAKLKQLGENFEVLELVNPSSLPTAPVGPQRLRITLTGGIVGFVVALVLVLLAGAGRERKPSESSSSAT